MNWKPGSKKGVIALATSRDGFRWSYRRVVLEEPFHLSYPYVFEAGSEYFMVPETAAAGSIRLYRADPFPERWVFVTDLVTGPVHLDNSVFHREGRWWLFTETGPHCGTLRLFHAKELMGPWSEHPKSPIVTADSRIARPAGRIVSMSDRLLRFAQDCRSSYGTNVHAVEIKRITVRDYDEAEIDRQPILAGSGHGWNRSGMHHLDAHELDDGSWLACVDGWSKSVRRPREIVRWTADHWCRTE
jgi:hypothetical protein